MQADPLAALNPLREPAQVGWWPPAPGWWLLAFIALLGLALIAVWLLRRHRRRSYRRQALRQLDTLCAQQRSGADPLGFVQRVNALLKSVAIRSFGARAVAAAKGSEWIAFLDRTGPEGLRFDPAFAEAGYRPDMPALDLDALAESARQWIRGHRELP